MIAGVYVTEKQFQAQVVQLARLCGWMVYHPWTSLHSTAGFPDLLLVRGEDLLLVELKTDRGRLSSAQETWLNALRRARRVHVQVWRPGDWERIVMTLQHGGGEWTG